MTTEQQELVMHGMPPVREFGIACHAQLAELRRHWRVIAGAAVEAGTGNHTARISLVERLYRKLDVYLFGRGRWRIDASGADGLASKREPASLERWHLAWCREAASRIDGECLCLEFEGLPMAQLEQAVRNRLGHPGGTLCARVWQLRGEQAPTLLLSGRLRLDHRSLHRSVALCATKVSALLKGAMARHGRQVRIEDVGKASTPIPLSAGSHLLRLAKSVLTRLWWREQWQLEVLPSGGVASSEQGVAVVIRPPDAAFWADPFLLRRNHRTWVLFEELAFATNRGHISAIEIDGSGRPIAAPQVVLREPWHLSYPFLWQEGERLYMIPEAGESRELTLYEAVGDEMKWQRRAVLISGERLADATVVRADDRLWMFATCASSDNASMEDTLQIYWSERIEGPWHPHALNPVKIDATCSRPAGSMRLVDGVLHRVVMDCSSTYGGSVRWMRVVRLTTDEFEEEAVPGWLPDREAQSEPWHTFNALDNMIVTDRQVRLPRWRTR